MGGDCDRTDLNPMIAFYRQIVKTIIIALSIAKMCVLRSKTSFLTFGNAVSFKYLKCVQDRRLPGGIYTETSYKNRARFYGTVGLEIRPCHVGSRSGLPRLGRT